MRILHVIQKLDIAGAELVALSLARGTRGRGHHVAVAAAPGMLSTEFECPQFKLPLLQRRPERIPKAAWRLHRALRNWRPDVVHCHNPTMALIGSLARTGHRRPAGLVTVHGLAEQDYRNATRLLRWASLPVVACGSDVTAQLMKHGMKVAGTIPNGIPEAPPPLDRSTLRRQLGLGEDCQLIVSVGRLVAQKNQAIAIRAMSTVPRAALVIIGEGELRGELVKLTELSGVADRVVFAGARPDARAVMAAADAVVISSDWEGLPLVALEALAAQTPLVATAASGVRGLVRDGVDCLLVQPGDESALGGALRKVLSDRELSARLASAGLSVAAAHSEERMLQRYAKFYTDLIETN